MKEFIKPTPAKVILFIILSAILWILTGGIAFRYAGGSMPILWSIIFTALDMGTALAAKLRLSGGDVINTVYSLIYWYLLSCAMMRLFAKVKGKKQSMPVA